jgi:hypothetical protein
MPVEASVRGAVLRFEVGQPRSDGEPPWAYGELYDGRNAVAFSCESTSDAARALGAVGQFATVLATGTIKARHGRDGKPTGEVTMHVRSVTPLTAEGEAQAPANGRSKSTTRA